MKKLLPVLSALILLASCDNDGYTIKGSFPGAEDGTLVYMTAADEFFTTIDSAVINNGCFEFKGGYYDRILRMLLVPGKAVGGPVVVEKGVVNVKIDKTIERGGTEGNAILQRFMDASEHYEGLVDITSPTYVKSMPLDKNVYDSLVVERDKAAGTLAAFAYLAIENNIDNSLGLFLITKSYKLVDAEKMAPLLERVPSYLRNARYDVVNDYVSVALASKKQKEAVSVGSVYLNFELPDISGKRCFFHRWSAKTGTHCCSSGQVGALPATANFRQLMRCIRNMQRRGLPLWAFRSTAVPTSGAVLPLPSLLRGYSCAARRAAAARWLQLMVSMPSLPIFS